MTTNVMNFLNFLKQYLVNLVNSRYVHRLKFFVNVMRGRIQKGMLSSLKLGLPMTELTGFH